MEIVKRLFVLRDENYAGFQRKLVPNVSPESIIGIRVPALRKLSKEFIKEDESGDFLKILPHSYYDENMLHALLICEIKDYSECVKALDKFLPYVDNWAVCDILSPKVFKNNRDSLIMDIKRWAEDEHEYTIRFGIGMLMSYFLDEDFKEEYLEIPAGLHSEKYYVNMMIAWFFATALAKKWDESFNYIKENRLDKWIHNKTIQKAVESYRISDERKEALRGLKR